MLSVNFRRKRSMPGRGCDRDSLIFDSRSCFSTSGKRLYGATEVGFAVIKLFAARAKIRVTSSEVGKDLPPLRQGVIAVTGLSISILVHTSSQCPVTEPWCGILKRHDLPKSVTEFFMIDDHAASRPSSKSPPRSIFTPPTVTSITADRSFGFTFFDLVGMSPGFGIDLAISLRNRCIMKSDGLNDITSTGAPARLE